MSVEPEILDWIREAAAEAESWEEIRALLQVHDPDGDDVRLRPFVFAFSYRLHERFSSTRERAGSPYGAMVAGEGWRFPPALADIEVADVAAWQEVLAAIDHPAVRARLGDLLWERRAHPDPHLAAAAAADGLLNLAADEVAAEIKLPPEEVERFLSSFTEAPTWQHALGLLAAPPPPGGLPQELAAEVDRLMKEFPVQFLFGKALIGHDNATAIFRASSPEEHHRLASAEQRAQHGRIWGMFCARVLQRIGERKDRPSREQLAELLQGDFLDDETAERVACAIELFWEERYDESAHVLVPRIERIVREMARQLGIPVVRAVEPGREIGGVVTLGTLLREMAPVFPDPDWHAYLLNLLADPLGLNLRNSISHGLHGRVGPVDASLLTQAALFLAGLSLGDSNEMPKPPPGAGAA